MRLDVLLKCQLCAFYVNQSHLILSPLGTSGTHERFALCIIADDVKFNITAKYMTQLSLDTNIENILHALQTCNKND